MKIRLNDKSLFGNDAGEDEDENILVSYFVDQPEFADFLDASARLQVARGRKGMGKSALLVKFAHDLRTLSAPPITLHLVPSSLAALKEPPETENSVLLENYWKQVICGAINMELANQIGFAWRDDDIALVETAELSGFKGRNLFGSLISRLISKINIGGVIDLQPTQTKTPDSEQLLARVRSQSATPRQIWFLLDDIDTKFKNTPNQQAYVSSFFSACRYLVREINGIGIRATVRSDVWNSLRAAEDLDKFDQYITDIEWTKAQQKDILANRILAYIRRNHPRSVEATTLNIHEHGDQLLDMVFAKRMRWGESVAPSIQILRILGGGRPRWMAQLCRMAGVEAHRSASPTINIGHINHVMGDFGRRRLSDLYKEHSHQFEDLKRLVESFSSGPRRYSTPELIGRIMDQYIRIRGAARIPSIDGSPYRDSWQVAHFLYKCNFFSGHNMGDRSLEVPEFVSYDERPDLLEVDTNLDDSMAWEIQPAYRKILRTQ